MENQKFKQMKKYLISFIFVIFTTLSFSQPLFHKAYNTSVGVRENYQSEITWKIKNESTAILVAYSQDKIEIFSNEIHTFRIIKMINSSDTETVWMSLDEDGIKCLVVAGISQNPETLYLKIEYNDFIVIYLTKSD
jgi:hypothetical protein